MSGDSSSHRRVIRVDRYGISGAIGVSRGGGRDHRWKVEMAGERGGKRCADVAGGVPDEKAGF